MTLITKENLQKENIERLNRQNFRVLMDCMAQPGSKRQLEPLFGSMLLGAASTLLYQEVTWHSTSEDFSSIALITGSKEAELSHADYVFAEAPSADLLRAVKQGTHESPELGATIFFMCNNLPANKVMLTGPGIEYETTTALPVDISFADELALINSGFPLGTDIFFIEDDGVTAISRTTRMELL